MSNCCRDLVVKEVLLKRLTATAERALVHGRLRVAKQRVRVNKPDASLFIGRVNLYKQGYNRGRARPRLTILPPPRPPLHTSR